MKKDKVIFIVFIAICLLIKVYFIAKDNPGLRFNDDDQRNYIIAQNNTSGKGYGIYDYMAHRYRLSAFHTSSTVFLYEFLINQQVPQKDIVIVFYILSTILYLLAVLYLYRLLRLLNIATVLVYIATALFALYPSVLYSMGAKYHFDNLVMPLHVINFYVLLKWIKGRSLALWEYIFLVLSITFCCFFRTQALMLYFITGCVLFFLFIKNVITKREQDKGMLYFLSALAVCIIIAFIPALTKNKKMFGAYIISTQAGFEFLHGHNSINGGNWVISTPGDPLDRYVHEKIPNVASLDEYAESKARGHLGLEWIKENPAVEVKYIFKKMGRYFVPENAAPLTIQPIFYYHPFTIFIHLLFLFSIFLFLFKDRQFLFSKEMLLLLVPVTATLLLSVIFFFDVKLRYHAEPFMIVIAAFAVDRYMRVRKARG